MGLLRRRPPNVEKMKRKADVEGLIRALRYEDPVVDRERLVVDLGVNVRAAAAEALGDLEAHAALRGLLRALDDPQPIVRVMAVRGLRERGDPLAAEELTSAATNWTDPEYADARAEAVEALAFLRDPTTPRRVAAGFLTRSAELDDEADAAVLRKLARAGGHDALTSTVADLVTRLREGSAPRRTRKLLVWLAPESVQPLIDALAVVPARRDAIAALGETHDSRAVEGLCTVLLGDDDPPVRAAAARALGEIRDPAAVEALLLSSGDGDYEIRTAASDSFDKLGNAAIAVALMSLVRPALENGSAPHQDAIDTAEAPAENEQAADPQQAPGPEQPPNEPEPQRAIRSGQPRQNAAPTQRPPGQRGSLSQLSPILRRWAGRRP